MPHLTTSVKLEPITHTFTAYMSIFCDGACKGNGQRGAVGGWAFAFWPGAARGEPATAGAEKLGLGPSHEPPTNQRAELKALLESLKFAATLSQPVTIYTDSMYAMNCATVWGPSWKKADWKRSSGEPLQNLDLIRPLVDVWMSKRVAIRHVRGHQTGSGPEVWGNNWVDRAAVAGAEGVTLTASVVSLSPAPSPSPSPFQSTRPPVKQADIRKWFS